MTTRTQTWCRTCGFTHPDFGDCPRWPAPAGRDDLSLEDFTAFTLQYGSTVINALQNHIHRMEEAAAEAEAVNAPAYAQVFRDSAEDARRALGAWEPLAEECR